MSYTWTKTATYKELEIPCSAFESAPDFFDSNSPAQTTKTTLSHLHQASIPISSRVDLPAHHVVQVLFAAAAYAKAAVFSQH